MFVRFILAKIERAGHMGRGVGVAHRQVHHIQPQLVVQLMHKADRLGQIGRRAALRADAKAPRVGVAVVDAKAGGNHKVVVLIHLGGADAVFQQAEAVFKAAAVLAGAVVGGCQLCQQVAVAALDVHRVKACFLGKGGCLAELFFQPFQVIVRHDAGVIRGAVLLQNRVAVGDHRGRLVAGVRVAAAVVGLHDQIRRIAVGLEARLLDGGGHLLELVQRVAGQQQLRLGGSSLLHNGDCLEPDDRAATDSLVDIAAGRILGGCAFGRRVRALHGRDAQTVREGNITHSQRLRQRVGVGCKGQVNTQLCGTLLDFF